MSGGYVKQGVPHNQYKWIGVTYRYIYRYEEVSIVQMVRINNWIVWNKVQGISYKYMLVDWYRCYYLKLLLAYTSTWFIRRSWCLYIYRCYVQVLWSFNQADECLIFKYQVGVGVFYC